MAALHERMIPVAALLLVMALVSEIIVYSGLVYQNRALWTLEDLLRSSMCVGTRPGS